MKIGNFNKCLLVANLKQGGDLIAEYKKGDFVCGTEQGTNRVVKGVYFEKIGDTHVVCEVIVGDGTNAPRIICESVAAIINLKQENPIWRLCAKMIQSQIGVPASLQGQPPCDCQCHDSCSDCILSIPKEAKGPKYAKVADIVHAIEAGTGRFVTGVVKEFVDQNVVVYELIEGKAAAPEVVCSSITKVLIGIELTTELIYKAIDLQGSLGRRVYIRIHPAGLDESELGVAHLPENGSNT